MRYYDRQHQLHIFFPLLLLLLYLALASSVVVFAGDSYRRTQLISSSSTQANTAIAYLTQRVHQGLQQGNVSLVTLEDTSCLLITSSEGGYRTYIYQWGDTLMELVLLDGVDASLSQGKAVLRISQLTMEETEPGFLRFVCLDELGNTYTRTVSMIPQGGAYENQ